MAYIRPLANGNFRADVRMKGVTKNKTFPIEKLAKDWAENLENSIKSVLSKGQAQLMALSDDEIYALGGEELFKQLGIDLFAIRHAAKLEALNALSKKELLQLSVQEIERMGGAELFVKAGKRIRYKTFREVCDEYLARWNKNDYQGQMQGVDYWCNALRAASISDRDTFNADGSIKLEKFTFHCLRHGFCSALSDSGKEINQIAKLAGHKSIQTTMRYIPPRPGPEAADRQRAGTGV